MLLRENVLLRSCIQLSIGSVSVVTGMMVKFRGFLPLGRSGSIGPQSAASASSRMFSSCYIFLQDPHSMMGIHERKANEAVKYSPQWTLFAPVKSDEPLLKGVNGPLSTEL